MGCLPRATSSHLMVGRDFQSVFCDASNPPSAIGIPLKSKRCRKLPMESKGQGTYILINTLNVNGLNAPTKKHRLAEWIQKQDQYIRCLQETHFRPRDTYRLKVRGWKKIFHVNGNHKKAEVAILISDKIDVKIKTVTRNKEGHYIMIKGSIQEENIIFINIYAHNIGAPQYISQTLTAIKGDIDINTKIVGDFNTSLTPIDRSSRQKINKETQALNDTMDQRDLIDIYRKFHLKVEEYFLIKYTWNVLQNRSQLGSQIKPWIM